MKPKSFPSFVAKLLLMETPILVWVLSKQADKAFSVFIFKFN